jgi:predicted nucleic acid-binding protein
VPPNGRSAGLYSFNMNANWFQKEGLDYGRKLDTPLIELNEEIDIERKKLIKGWGMADSIILATARVKGAKIVTGDQHFKDLKNNVIFI